MLPHHGVAAMSWKNHVIGHPMFGLPTDCPIYVLFIGKDKAVRAQHDTASNRWFTDQGHAFRPDQVVMWKRLTE